MSNQKMHSAGPWTWTGTGYICGGPEGRNAICEPFGREADARLIAAAPDLLAACKRLVESHGAHGPCSNNSCRECSAAYKAGLAAIAAAES